MTGKPNRKHGGAADGNGYAWACESVIGSTWNTELAYEQGKIVGNESIFLGVNGWYGPGLNIHRNPLSGRNFEYYSQDGVHGGCMAAAVIKGATDKGVHVYMKHAFLNDQETGRMGTTTFATEQAIREIYAKSFEIAVKEGNANGVMSSFNRIGTVWTGGDYRLMTEILREEWGFEGLVISDYKTDNAVMNSRQMLYAGNDLILASLDNLLWTDCDFSSPQDVTILRNSSHNILYVVANSNSMNVDIVGYNTEWWITTLYVVDAVAVVALAVWGVFVIRKNVKKQNASEE